MSQDLGERSCDSLTLERCRERYGGSALGADAATTPARAAGDLQGRHGGVSMSSRGCQPYRPNRCSSSTTNCSPEFWCAKQRRPARQTRMYASRGETARQDPSHLPDLPRGHPRRSETNIPLEMTTGELCVRETDKHGSGRGLQKGPDTTGTSLAARFTRREAQRNGPGAIPAPRSGPTQRLIFCGRVPLPGRGD